MHFERDQVKVFKNPTTRINVVHRTIEVTRVVKKRDVELMVVGMG